MNTYKLSNVSLEEFRRFLKQEGCIQVPSKVGGHEKWKREGCLRPIVLQTHVDPVPELVIRSNLRTLGLTRADFIKWLKKK